MPFEPWDRVYAPVVVAMVMRLAPLPESNSTNRANV